MLEPAKSDGTEVSDETLESISGGSWDTDKKECPDDQHNLVHAGSYPAGHAVFDRYECAKCGYQELVLRHSLSRRKRDKPVGGQAHDDGHEGRAE